MKCTSKLPIALILCAAMLLCGCQYSKFDMPFTADSRIGGFSVIEYEGSGARVDSFASELCVVESDVLSDSVNISSGSSVGLYDIYDQSTLYSKNAHTQVYPASLTKIMTALVALKHGSIDSVLTASTNVKINEYDAQKMNLNVGDQMTLNQALHILLIYSANDVANLIAENVGGSMDHFVEMMNEEAVRLGATNTHFVNPNGLSDENHYTTAYDLYLIMNEACKYELFNEIIGMPSYETVYYDGAGNEKSISVKSTNLYIRGTENAPSGITVIGGKTGSTNAAGHCLILISRDIKSKPYISIVMKSESREELYKDMNSLLTLAP